MDFLRNRLFLSNVHVWRRVLQHGADSRPSSSRFAEETRASSLFLLLLVRGERVRMNLASSNGKQTPQRHCLRRLMKMDGNLSEHPVSLVLVQRAILMLLPLFSPFALSFYGSAPPETTLRHPFLTGPLSVSADDRDDTGISADSLSQRGLCVVRVLSFTYPSRQPEPERSASFRFQRQRSSVRTRANTNSKLQFFTIKKFTN